jgi:lipoprotein-anchoring transpeptidase ErfK/SrfK
MELDFEVKEIRINVKEKKIYFKTEEGSLIFDCEIGDNGFSPEGEEVEGDEKTPLGNFKVEFVRLPKEGQTEVFTVTRHPERNMGPVFICLNCKYNGRLRGIGIHGGESPEKSEEPLAPTQGCIRMRNPDLNILKDKIEVGIPVFIEAQ